MTQYIINGGYARKFTPKDSKESLVYYRLIAEKVVDTDNADLYTYFGSTSVGKEFKCSEEVFENIRSSFAVYGTFCAELVFDEYGKVIEFEHIT